MLSVSDQLIVQTFKQHLSQVLTDYEVRAFGSRARGDADPDSELDLFIEVETMTPTLRHHISEVAWQVGFDAGIVISTFVVTREQLTQGASVANPLVLTVMSEGVPM